MNAITKLIRGDNTRKTRFHTSNGYLCLHPSEFLRAFASTIIRMGAKRYSRSPWLVYSATAYVDPVVAGKRIFEFGSGMSTLWFSERCREVISVEHDLRWHASITRQAKGRKNVRLIYADSKTDYLGAISEAGGDFDLILVDGIYREDCVELARSFLSPNGMIIVDNTDRDSVLPETVKKEFGDGEIRAFRGWGPGILHPFETTVIQNIPLIRKL